jgi:ApeA N-terminal domain 1
MADENAMKQDSVYSSEVGLFEKFDLRGKWWLPDAPDDRVHGTVTYSPVQGITLRLDGKFQHPELQEIFLLKPFKSECILGESVEDEFVTLHRVFASRVSRTDTFRANTLIIGERFGSVSDFRISGALIGYTNLEEWTAVRMLRMEKGTSTDSYRVAIPTPTTDLFEVRDRAPFQELKLVAGVQSAQGVTNFSAQMRAFFDCAFQHPVQLREAQGIVGQLGNLLSLLQGETTYATQVRVKIAPAESLRTANLFWVPRAAEPPIVSHSDMNLSFQELANNAEGLFGSWFANERLFEPVYDLLVGTYGKQSERFASPSAPRFPPSLKRIFRTD